MKQRLKPELKVAESLEALRDMPNTFIIDQLEENIKLREMPIEKQLKEKRLKGT